MEELREVEFAEAEALCQYIPEIRLCMETSAKDNKNITEAFVALATELKVSFFCCRMKEEEREINFLILSFQRRQDNLSSDEEAERGIKLGHGEALDSCSAANCSAL